jgi:hypothetical protein
MVEGADVFLLLILTIFGLAAAVVSMWLERYL